MYTRYELSNAYVKVNMYFRCVCDNIPDDALKL